MTTITEFIDAHTAWTDDNWFDDNAAWHMPIGDMPEMISAHKNPDDATMAAIEYHIDHDVPTWSVLYGWAAPIDDNVMPSKHAKRVRCRVYSAIPHGQIAVVVQGQGLQIGDESGRLRELLDALLKERLGC